MSDKMLLLIKKLRLFWISTLVCLLDIGSKYFVITHLYPGESLTIFPCINITYIENAGIAFSLFSDWLMLNAWILNIITIVIICALSIGLYYSQDSKKTSNYFYSIIIGSALGNLINRIMYGVIFDFIDIRIKSWHFPTFNMADLGIFISMISIYLDNILFRKKE